MFDASEQDAGHGFVAATACCALSSARCVCFVVVVAMIPPRHLLTPPTFILLAAACRSHVYALLARISHLAASMLIARHTRDISLLLPDSLMTATRQPLAAHQDDREHTNVADLVGLVARS